MAAYVAFLRLMGWLVVSCTAFIVVCSAYGPLAVLTWGA